MANIKALIVEDSPTMRQLLLYALKRIPGITSAEASDGVDGLQKCQAEKPDIILTDINMPVMDGFQAFPLLREARPDMKIIICTGYQIDSMSQQLLESGATALLRKPFKLDALASTLAGAIPEADAST